MLASAIVAGSVLPAASDAATVSADGACFAYWPSQGSQPIPVTIAGLLPGQSVRLTLEVRGEAVSGLPSLAADAAGAVSTRLSSWTSGLPNGPSHSTPASLVVTDPVTSQELARTAIEVTNVGIRVRGAGRVSERRTWEISGLRPLGGRGGYWAHYFAGGEEVGRQRLGSAHGACGYLRVRRVLVPFSRTGTAMVEDFGSIIELRVA